MTADEAPERPTRLLQIAGTVEAAGEPLDVEDLVQELGGSALSVRAEIEQLDGMGLLLSGLDEGHPPMLLNAGKQYLARRGLVPHEILCFLPRVIDDLHSREALLQAGITLVDEFRYKLLNGGAVEHAAQLVPSAFAQAVDEPLALNLFAAAVALMTRLSEGRPAGCVAEEIMAVGLIGDAESWLDIRRDRQELSEAEATAAIGELRAFSICSKTTMFLACSTCVSLAMLPLPVTILLVAKLGSSTSASRAGSSRSGGPYPPATSANRRRPGSPFPTHGRSGIAAWMGTITAGGRCRRGAQRRGLRPCGWRHRCGRRFDRGRGVLTSIPQAQSATACQDAGGWTRSRLASR
jgi:hypothetical protein